MSEPCPNRSRACFARGCRDEGCREAKRRYNRRSAKLCRMGRTAMVDAAPVREHVRALMAAGMGYRRVAAVAGMTHQGVQKIIGSGGAPARKVRRETAAALLAVTVNPHPRRPVDVCGTRRRIQGLVRVGWTQQQVADALRVGGKEVSRMLLRADRVSRERAAAVADVYDRLGMTYPMGRVADRSRARAAGLGWVSPLGWMDVDIDDPAAVANVGSGERRGSEPDASEVVELVAGRMPATRASKASRAEAFARLFNAALSIEEVADRMQVSTRTAERAKARHAAAEVSEDVA